MHPWIWKIGIFTYFNVSGSAIIRFYAFLLLRCEALKYDLGRYPARSMDKSGQPTNRASIVGRLLSGNWHISYFNVSGYAAILFLVLRLYLALLFLMRPTYVLQPRAYGPMDSQGIRRSFLSQNT